MMNVSHTMTGARIAGQPDGGFGVVVTDRHTSTLEYVHSPTGAAWSTADPVYGTGTGGWCPSLAYDPTDALPAIAFYGCSPRSSVDEAQCLQSEDRLIVSRLFDELGPWRETEITSEGGWAPVLMFFADGRSVVVYRVSAARDSVGGVNPRAGELKIAIENR